MEADDGISLIVDGQLTEAGVMEDRMCEAALASKRTVVSPHRDSPATGKDSKILRVENETVDLLDLPEVPALPQDCNGTGTMATSAIGEMVAVPEDRELEAALFPDECDSGLAPSHDAGPVAVDGGVDQNELNSCNQGGSWNSFLNTLREEQRLRDEANFQSLRSLILPVHEAAQATSAQVKKLETTCTNKFHNLDNEVKSLTNRIAAVEQAQRSGGSQHDKGHRKGESIPTKGAGKHSECQNTTSASSQPAMDPWARWGKQPYNHYDEKPTVPDGRNGQRSAQFPVSDPLYSEEQVASWSWQDRHRYWQQIPRGCRVTATLGNLGRHLSREDRESRALDVLTEMQKQGAPQYAKISKPAALYAASVEVIWHCPSDLLKVQNMIEQSMRRFEDADDNVFLAPKGTWQERRPNMIIKDVIQAIFKWADAKGIDRPALEHCKHGKVVWCHSHTGKEMWGGTVRGQWIWRTNSISEDDKMQIAQFQQWQD